MDGPKLLAEYSRRGQWSNYTTAELEILRRYLLYDVKTPWAVNTARWIRRILNRRRYRERNATARQRNRFFLRST